MRPGVTLPREPGAREAATGAARRGSLLGGPEAAGARGRLRWRRRVCTRARRGSSRGSGAGPSVGAEGKLPSPGGLGTWSLLLCRPAGGAVDRQLKDIVEKQEPDVNYLRAMLIDAESLLIAKEINISESAIPLTSTTPAEDQMEDPGYGVDLPPNTVVCSSRDHSEEKIVDTSCNIPHVLDSKEVLPTDNEPRSPQMSTSIHNNDGREIIEQFEPGVYITVVLLHNGIKAFKRVKFSKRRFAEQQAEDWWRQNKDRVFKKYSNRGMDSSHAPYTQLKTASAAEEDDVVPSHP